MNNDKVNPKNMPKKIVLLQCLLQQSLNTFEANSLYKDSCLHTTISDLKRRYGFEFNKKSEVVRCRGGRTVRCMRYALSDQDLDMAKMLVKEYGGDYQSFSNSINRN